MKRFIILIAVITFAAALSTNVAAQSTSGQFGKMDKDRDGRVSWQEFKGYHTGMGKEDFGKADANGDGAISHEEWYAFEGKPGMGRGRGDYDRYGQGKGRGKKEDATRRTRVRETRFSQMDADGSGRLSYDEVKARDGSVSMEQFERADGDHDGSLDHDEWARSRTQFEYGTGKVKK